MEFSKDINENVNGITFEEILKYRDFRDKMDCLVKEYSKSILPDWKHYSGWSFSQKDKNSIIINCHYNDIVNNIEYETVYESVTVDIEKLLSEVKQ